jgi:hypothetical protein
MYSASNKNKRLKDGNETIYQSLVGLPNKRGALRSSTEHTRHTILCTTTLQASAKITSAAHAQQQNACALLNGIEHSNTKQRPHIAHAYQTHQHAHRIHKIGYTLKSAPVLLACGVTVELLRARGVSRRLSQLLREPQMLMCFSERLRRRSRLLQPPLLVPTAWSQLPRLLTMPWRAPWASLPTQISSRTGRGTPPGPIRVAQPVGTDATGLRPEPKLVHLSSCVTA